MEESSNSAHYTLVIYIARFIHSVKLVILRSAESFSRNLKEIAEILPGDMRSSVDIPAKVAMRRHSRMSCESRSNHAWG